MEHYLMNMVINLEKILNEAENLLLRIYKENISKGGRNANRTT